MSSLFFPICAVLISLTIAIIFFSKRRVESVETKLYSFFILFTLLESIVACIIVTIAKMVGTIDILYFLNRVDYILIITLVWLLFVYVFTLSYHNSKRYKQFISITMIFNLIIIAAIFMLNLEIINYGEVIDTDGSAMYLTYATCAFYTLLIIISVTTSIFIKKRKLELKKLIPLLVLIVLAIFTLTIRSINPSILLESLMFAYVAMIMFFTIENPDLKLINELNLAKDYAEKANQMKTDFLSSMSHEIRTPLNAIMGFSQSIKEADNLDEAKEYAGDVIKSSGILLEIVNGILDISKIEAGKLEIENNPYNSHELFGDLVRLIEPRILQKGLELKVNIARDLPVVLEGDALNLKKGVLNLLTNAIKYTKEGQVELNVNYVNKNKVCRMLISVEDTGRGINPEKIDKLFEKFERIDEDINTTTEGTGLGLAITKQLIELMGGQIVVQSVYGSGSKFTIAIDQKIINDVSPTVKEEKTVEDELPLNIKGKKILIVDDNKINIKVAKSLLKKYELEISEVLSGRECLDKINNKEEFDLILMDIMMPIMDGVETLKRLKQIDGFNIPVIALTADAIDGMEEKYLQDGFDDYVSKPINVNKLKQVLRKYLTN